MAFTNWKNPDHSSVGKEVIEDHAHLLVGVTAKGDGEWFDCRGVTGLSFMVSGMTSGSVELDGSNATEIPADDTHKEKIKNRTSNGHFALNGGDVTRWAKVRVQRYVSGTISVSVKRKRYKL